MLNLLVFLALFFVILIFGQRLLSVFAKHIEFNLLEKLFIGFGIGAGLLALIILFVGMIGFLYKSVILVLLIALCAISVTQIKKVFKDISVWLNRIRKEKFSYFELFLLFCILFVWSFALVGSMTPLIGTDAASYHLQDPKIFILQHKITHIPYTRESLWPFLIQMLFTLGLLLKGVVVAKLFNFTFGLLSIVAVYSLCRRQWQRTPSLLAASVIGLMPAVFTSAKYAYTDLAVVFYTAVSFYLVFLWLQRKEMVLFYLCALFCGFLLGIKIVLVTAVAVILILYIFNAGKEKPFIKGVLVHAAVFLTIIFATCGIWYLRSWIILGNPVYPFAGYLFGGHGYPEEYLRYHTTSGIGMGIIQYLKIPWLITLYPDIFGGESVGPIFLIFLPMAIFIRRPSKFVKQIMFIAVVLYASWFIVYQYVRFLYPTLIFASILVAYLYFETCSKEIILRKAAQLTIVIIFCFSLVLSVYHNLDNSAVAFGLEGQKDYLMRREKSCAMADYINNNLPKDARIFILSDPHLFYIDRYAADGFCFKMETRYDKKHAGTPDEIAGFVKSKGFGYILSVKDYTPGRKDVGSEDPRSIFGEKNVIVIKEINFSYKEEKFTYSLWKLSKNSGQKI